MANKPTITYSEFISRAVKAHDELLEFVHILQCETLPLLAANSFHEEQTEPLVKALEVLKLISKQD